MSILISNVNLTISFGQDYVTGAEKVFYTQITALPDFSSHLPYKFYRGGGDSLCLVRKERGHLSFINAWIPKEKDIITLHSEQIKVIFSKLEDTDYLFDFTKQEIIAYKIMEEKPKMMVYSDKFSDVPPRLDYNTYLVKSEKDNKFFKFYVRNAWHIISFLSRKIKEGEIFADVGQIINLNSMKVLVALLSKKHDFTVPRYGINTEFINDLEKVLISEYFNEFETKAPKVPEEHKEVLMDMATKYGGKTIEKEDDDLILSDLMIPDDDLILGNLTRSRILHQDKLTLSELIRSGFIPKEVKYQKVEIDIVLGNDVKFCYIGQGFLYFELGIEINEKYDELRRKFSEILGLDEESIILVEKARET